MSLTSNKHFMNTGHTQEHEDLRLLGKIMGLLAGYPLKSIKTEYTYENYRFDVVCLDEEGNPEVVFEAGNCSKEKIASLRKKLVVFHLNYGTSDILVNSIINDERLDSVNNYLKNFDGNDGMQTYDKVVQLISRQDKLLTFVDDIEYRMREIEEKFKQYNRYNTRMHEFEEMIKKMDDVRKSLNKIFSKEDDSNGMR